MSCTSPAVSVSGVRHDDGANGRSSDAAVGVEGIPQPVVQLITETSVNTKGKRVSRESKEVQNSKGQISKQCYRTDRLASVIIIVMYSL